MNLFKGSLIFQTPTFVLICMLSFACSEPSVTNQKLLETSDFSLEIDTVLLEPVQSSQIGSFYLKDNAIFYVDKAYGLVEEFTVEGESNGIRKRELDGPEELQGVSELIPTKDGFIIRHDWSFYQYDSNWEFIGKSIFQSASTVSYQEMMDNPKGEYMEMYELLHYNPKTVELPDGFLAIKLDVEHPIFNAFISREYYRESRVLGRVNPFSGMMVEMLGNRPDTYERYKFIPFHVMLDFHWTKDNSIYVTYEADSMIYVYDQSWKLKETFGAAGIAMKTDYVESQDLDVAFESKYFYHSRKNEGFYKDIFVDEENELVFRTYRQGSDRQDLLDETYNPLRMQIFREGKLLGDFSVPGRFRILGKVGDRYVADGYFDEQNEKQGFYLLNLN
ncbi:hypothetical protein [Algoriphagus marinus]|uniref:hypothetical protein n=1 Tax=Algoriphagus marinus TaxID=1925762 RepID=UPI0011154185|nr:hypothetical protein [Algoriphagus marinus]